MDKEKVINKGLTYVVKPTNQTGNFSSGYTKRETDRKLKDINYILISVILILLLMVATLIIDSFHFNSVVYKEYSQKTEFVETVQKTNETLLRQIQDLAEQNKQDRETIKQLLKK